MRTLTVLAVLTALGCATTDAGIRAEPLGREPAERNVFAELALPALRDVGVQMGANERELTRGDRSLTLLGELRCLEREFVVSRAGKLLAVDLVADLRWKTPAGVVQTLRLVERKVGANLRSTCDKLMQQHGKALSAAIADKTTAAFDGMGG